MKPKTVLRRGTIAAISLLMLAPCCAWAGFPTAVEFLPGFWAGFAQSAVSGGPVQNSSFVITAQRGAIFRGVATLPAVQTPGTDGGGVTPFFCDGSVTPAGLLNAVGFSANGLVVFLHGATRAFGDGSVRLASLQFVEFSFFGQFEDGGYQALVQRIGGINWGDLQVPAVQGNWIGNWLSSGPNGSGGPASLAVGAQRGSAFLGSLTFDTSTDAGAAALFDFGLEGTVGLPAVQDGASHTGMLGADTHGIIAVLIGLLLPAVQTPGTTAIPAQIQGNYALFGNLADVYATLVLGRASAFDSGRLGVHFSQ